MAFMLATALLISVRFRLESLSYTGLLVDPTTILWIKDSHRFQEFQATPSLHLQRFRNLCFTERRFAGYIGTIYIKKIFSSVLYDWFVLALIYTRFYTVFKPFFLILLSVLVGVATFSSEAQAKQSILSYRVSDDHEGFTRFVMDVSGKPEYSIFALSSPERLVIDIENAERAESFKTNKHYKSAIIDNVRSGIKDGHSIRVVLDLNAPIRVKKAFLIPPGQTSSYRLVVDIGYTAGRIAAPSKAAPPPIPETAESLPWQRIPIPQPAPIPTPMAEPIKPIAPHKPAPVPEPVEHMALPEAIEDDPTFITASPGAEDVAVPPPVPTPKPVREQPQNSTPYMPLIIIDPGHGGVDPGAIGKSGTKEKNLTLAYALALKERIEKEGKYRVILTRDKDVFVSLRDRVHKAQKAEGDLFISLHADSHPQPRTRGLSVYTLSETASDKEAEALANMENKSDVLRVDLADQNDEIADILIDLVQRESKNSSSRFAEGLVGTLKEKVTLLPNTHRFAGFRVLTAPDIPSVLVEMGYLSNVEEEKSLNSPDYKNKLVSAIVHGVNKYFDSKKSF